MKINILDLFAGCGGFSNGFEKAGFNILGANDILLHAANTYKKNHKKTEFILGDITKGEIKKKLIDLAKKNKCQIIIGGPPCQAYSMAGARNVDDPRGKLFNDYLDMVNSIKPKIFIMENVKGLLSMKHDKQDGLSEDDVKKLDKLKKLENEKNFLLLKRKQSLNTKSVKFDNTDQKRLKIISDQILLFKENFQNLRVPVLDTLKKEFEKIGYHIQIKLLNSANFGVPQKRERVIIFGGFKNTGIKFPEESHSETQNEDKNLKLFDKTKKDWVTVKDAIDDLKNKKEDILFSHIFNKNSSSFVEKIKKTPIGKSLYKNFSDAYFRCHPNKPSKTVKENHGGVFIHYEKDRFLTPRELARLQSFDDKFLFEGNKSQILVQIGNAVPPKLGLALAKQAAELL